MDHSNNELDENEEILIDEEAQNIINEDKETKKKAKKKPKKKLKKIRKKKSGKAKKNNKEKKNIEEKDESKVSEEKNESKVVEEKDDTPVGKKLQLLLLIPLISTILLSSLIVLAVVFITQQSWVVDTKDYIIEKERMFIENYLLTESNIIEASLMIFYLNLYTLTEIFKKQLDGTITASTNLQDPNPINAYNALNFSYPNTVYSEWVVGPKGYSDSVSTKFNISDAIMRTDYISSRNYLQVGFILNEVTSLDGNGEDLLYVYPVENMDFITKTYNYSATCDIDNSTYSTQCTESYNYLFGDNLHILVYYENERFFVILNFEEDDIPMAGLYIIQENYLSKRMINDTGYKTFSCDVEGRWTLVVSDQEIETFTGENKEISMALYGTNDKSRKDFRSSILSYMNLTDFNTTYSSFSTIDGKITYFSLKRLNFTTDGGVENNYVIGTLRTEDDILESWNNFNDDVLIIMIIQTCILVGFIIIAVLVALRLALVIVHRVSEPIKSISNYLKKGEPPLHLIKLNYNRELNAILDDLRRIEVIQKFIDPHFLMNQTLEIRILNLEEARNLFKKIENKRAEAIVLNLLGNLKYLDKKLPEAENYYRAAVKALEEQLCFIENQEKKESVLNDSEKKKIIVKDEESEDFWHFRKSLIKDALIDQMQQLCEVIISQLNTGSNSDTLTAIRARWKEVINLQERALQHYQDTRENCIDYFNLLIKMAEVFRLLNYYHTAKELLDIVYEDLYKINTFKIHQVDVDVGRLRKIGIQIKESEKKKNFLIGNLTYEKDILLQRLFYLRGLIHLDVESYHLAGRDFQLAIISGTYFDNEVRSNSIRELHSLFKRFDLSLLVPDLEELYNKSLVSKDNYLLGLAFDLNTNESLSFSILNLVTKLISSGNNRLGAINKNFIGKNLELVERDFHEMDLENLIIQSRQGNDNENLIDLMVRGFDMINNFDEQNTGKNYFIVFYKKETDSISMAGLDLLYSKASDKVVVIFVSFGDIFRLDFEIFIENIHGESIDADENEFYECEEMIKNILETS